MYEIGPNLTVLLIALLITIYASIKAVSERGKK